MQTIIKIKCINILFKRRVNHFLQISFSIGLKEYQPYAKKKIAVYESKLISNSITKVSMQFLWDNLG